MADAISRYIFRAPISRIGVKPGRRHIDAPHVAALQVSFAEIGQRSPISLILVAPDDPARDAYTYWLNAGCHRLHAARGLDWADIDATLDDDDALSAKIAEVDENLIRRDLNALERPQATHARLEAWAARYPERVLTAEDKPTKAKRGRPQKLRHGAAISAPVTMGFAADTAAATGFTRRTIERDLAIYRDIPASLQAKLAGSPIAESAALLRQLAALGDPDEKAKVAEVLLQGQTRNFTAARAIASGNTPSKAVRTPTDDRVKALLKLWGTSTPSEQDAFLLELSGRVQRGRWKIEEGQACVEGVRADG